MQELSSHIPSRHTLSREGADSDTTASSFQRFNISRSKQLKDAWRELTSTGRYAEPFYQPEWIASYAHAFTDSGEISAITTHRGDDLVGVLPLHYQKSFFGGVPAHTLRSLSGIHSCRFDMIHRDGARMSVAESTWNALRTSMPWMVIELLDVPADGSAHDLLTLARQDGFPVGSWATRRMPLMSLSEERANPFSHCPKDSRVYRTRLNSKLRKLKSLGDVALRVYPTKDTSALNDFINLEGRGWKGTHGAAIGKTKSTRAFYDLIAEAAAQRGYLNLYSLELNGEPISMHFGLLMNGCYYAPKVAYDERYAMYSPGQLLVKLVIEDLSKRANHTYDFLGPRARWKSVWTSTVRDHYNLYIFRPTLRGRALHALTMRAGALARRVKYQAFGDPQA